jgi:ethanolaminephosphotransferase
MRWVHLLLILAIHLVGITLFCLGFFPSKVVLSGYGQFQNGEFDPQFNKVVVMVVDALRSDFVFSDKSSMLFVQSLLRDGSAIGYTAFSNPPTVTLPRLKGITTGSTPNFLDAVLNVVEDDTSSTLASQDSWLKQLKLAGKKIHMFGDDTWIKLFPGLFDKSEGTSSFFVSDFTEVDNNVTRNLDEELIQQNWDCLILHYLGLDHIGHKGGPESLFMPPKQVEMDGIAQRIYESLDADTLFVLLGDHGMNEIGNHGGSSAGETSAALVLISNKFKQLKKNLISPLKYNDDYRYYDKIEQIDLVPTLCSLLRIPIPKNSLGVIIRDFLPLWSSKQRENVLNENLLHYQNFKVNDQELEDEYAIYEFLHDTQSDLTRSATNYDVKTISYGLATAVLVVILSISRSFILFKNQGFIMISMILIYSLTSVGSSLIEEEHQIWWWFATFYTVVFCYHKPWNLTLILTFLRVLRGWNNSGQKFVGDTLAAYFQENVYFNWIVTFITISAYAFSLHNGGLSRPYPVLSFVTTFSISMCLFAFKLLYAVANGDAIPKELIHLTALSMKMLGVSTAQESLVDSARVFFTSVLGLFLIRVGLRIFQGNKYWFFTDIHSLLSFVLIFQTSIPNIGIFLVLLGIKHEIGYIVGSSAGNDRFKVTGFLTLSLIILQNLTFFSFGGTNSLNTVDLSNAYNGVKSYNMFTVGILTFLSNFSGPVYWVFASLPIMLENDKRFTNSKMDLMEARWTTNILFYSLSTLLILISCFFQRYHLFVWTVFSPKVLYTIVWNFFVNFATESVVLVFAVLF